MKDAEVHAAVHNLLMEQGRYDPFELLLRMGILDYPQYRAWRCGERETLDLIQGRDAVAVEEILRTAAAWAARLGLDDEVVEPWGWEANAGTQLSASVNSRLDRLLCTTYRPADARDQLDLFSDGARTVALRDMIDSLTARDRKRSREAMERLAALEPGHRDLAGAARLLDAMDTSAPSGPPEAEALLDRLEQEWLPAANALLGARSRDFLAPAWQAAAAVLEGERFDPERPLRHGSWLFAQCLDWQGVRRSVRATEGYRQQPVLMSRLAEAERRLGRRAAAMELWFELCWIAPEAFRRQVESARFPDWAVTQSWHRAKIEDLDPEITPEWFPAWMLLEEPGLARVLPPAGRDDAPSRAYDLLRELLLNGQHDAETEVELRRRLRVEHAGLLARYLASL